MNIVVRVREPKVDIVSRCGCGEADEDDDGGVRIGPLLVSYIYKS